MGNGVISGNCRGLFLVWLAVAATGLNGLLTGSTLAAGTVHNPFAYPTPPGVTTAAIYFDLRNDTGQPLVLTGATVPGTAAAEIHRHQQRAGMLGMRPQDQVTVAAHETVSFAPGGYHLMLMGLARPLQVGESVTLQLQFAGAEPLSVTVPVIEMGSLSPSPGHGSMPHGTSDGKH